MTCFGCGSEGAPPGGICPVCGHQNPPEQHLSPLPPTEERLLPRPPRRTYEPAGAIVAGTWTTYPIDGETCPAMYVAPGRVVVFGPGSHGHVHVTDLEEGV